MIDAAKAGIEHFMLKRAVDPTYATDRFFLVTFEDAASAIKVRFLLTNRLHYSPHSSPEILTILLHPF